ncbi:hypothetical protein [Mycobacterium sp.]|uniref:hypothetical protein n=1 Tax=Mycobacterium sp. TaxID=1785 RepID=UPI003C76E19C
MNENPRNLTIDRDPYFVTEQSDTDGGGHVRLWVNWALALATVAITGFAMIYALGAVMNTAACSDWQCPDIGPSGISFDALFYGAPVVALVVVLVSFFTAKRRWGVVVPLCGLALVAADIVTLGATVVQ